MSTDQTVVTSFYHGKYKQQRQERDVCLLIQARRFNNFIKSATIGRALHHATPDQPEKRVLDLCGGTGGDVFKFFRACTKPNWIALVCMVDIAPNSVMEAQRRLNQSTADHGQEKKNRPVFFFQGDAFSLDRMDGVLPRSEYAGQFNVVNCQFALHYAFSSVEKVREALTVVSTYLAKGGIYIVTVPNAEFIQRQLAAHREQSTRSDLRVVKTPYYQLEFDDPARPDRYLFTMGDRVHQVPEYLVPRQLLETEARRAGLDLLEWTPFQEYYQRFISTMPGQVLATKMIQSNPPDPTAWSCAELYVVAQFRRI